jgi:hypothetical protein
MIGRDAGGCRDTVKGSTAAGGVTQNWSMMVGPERHSDQRRAVLGLEVGRRSRATIHTCM